MFSFLEAGILILLTLVLGSMAQSSTASSSGTSSATSQAPPQTHTVTVGKGTNSYDPDTIQALPGDLIVFEFFPTNHSVVRASYGYPCVPYEDTAGPDAAGFFSGHFPLETIQPNPPTWNLTVNDTEPVFFYCSAVGSCIDFQMVGVINPNGTEFLANQKAAAKAADYMLEPGQPFPEEAASSMSSIAATATATVTSATSAPTTAGPPLTVTTTHTGLSSGAIAGIVVAGFIVLLLGAALFFFIGRNSTLRQALAFTSHPSPTARSSMAPPPPPPAKDMSYPTDHTLPTILPYKSDPCAPHHRIPSYDVPPYSLAASPTPDAVAGCAPTAEELSSVVGSSPRMSPRSFGPGPRYTPGTEYGNFLATGGMGDQMGGTGMGMGMAPTAAAGTPRNLSQRSGTMFREVGLTGSQRNSRLGVHEMDAS